MAKRKKRKKLKTKTKIKRMGGGVGANRATVRHSVNRNRRRKAPRSRIINGKLSRWSKNVTLDMQQIALMRRRHPNMTIDEACNRLGIKKDGY